MPDSTQAATLVQMATAGDVSAVGEQWMTLLESDSVTPEVIVEVVPVLEALVKRGRAAEASTLAWAALEMLGDRYGETGALRAAGPIVLKLPQSEEVRGQITELYRKAHADRPGIEALLADAGIAGGRPPRRAVRTLDVCLTVKAGDYLAARHDNSSAQLSSLDEQAWRFRVRTPTGERELGPVELADKYEPVDADDYRVLRDFNRPRLVEKIEKEPVGIVVSILQAQGRTIDGDMLKDLLCPSLIEPRRWSKWWAKARTALKRCPNVAIEGRAPFYLTYRREGRTLEQETAEQFAKLHHPAKQLAAADAYLRESRARKQTPDRQTLGRLRDQLAAQSQRQAGGSPALAMTTRLVQRHLELELGETGAEDAVVEQLASATDPVACVRSLEVTALWKPACDCLERALPDRRAELFAELLPVAPLAVCDDIAVRLAAARFTTEQFDSLVQSIMADPVKCHDALFWLWNGPTDRGLCTVADLKLLTRILWLLGETRRREGIGKEEARVISAGARAVLSARKFKRFKACLDGLEPGMVLTLRNQIRRLDNLGRAVHEDLLKTINRRFPQLDVAPKIAPWADESVIWVTSTGMVRKQQEVEHHINVTMRDNARRIGEAASHGDLSENSEYKFALEERDLLRARLAQMREQMSLAKILEPESVPTDHVGVGSRAILRHVETGTRVKMSLLGPWDAAIERHIYNYKTPLAQSLMGRTIGDHTELTAVEPNGIYEIVAIENGLA